MPSPLPPSATSAPIWPSPKMPSVEPRIRCDSVQGHLPLPHPLGLERDVAARGDDQRQGQLGRRHRRVADAGRDRDAEFGRGGEIEHVRVAADQRDQLQLRQPLQQRTREFDPLADRHHHVGILQPIDELVEIARRLAIALHVVVADQREARKLIDHVLVVVGDDDFHRVGFQFGSSTQKSFRFIQYHAIRSAARPITSPRSTSSWTASASSSGRTSDTSGNTSPRATRSSDSSTSLRVT